MRSQQPCLSCLNKAAHKVCTTQVSLLVRTLPSMTVRMYPPWYCDNSTQHSSVECCQRRWFEHHTVNVRQICVSPTHQHPAHSCMGSRCLTLGMSDSTPMHPSYTCARLFALCSYYEYFRAVPISHRCAEAAMGMQFPKGYCTMVTGKGLGGLMSLEQSELASTCLRGFLEPRLFFSRESRC